MLENIFTSVFNMGITASLTAAVIICIRLALKNRLPRVFSYALWAVVLVRLLVPFSFASVFSLFNVLPSPAATAITGSFQSLGTVRYIPQDMGRMQKPEINTGNKTIDNAANGSLPQATPQASVNPMQVILFIAALLWASGAVSLFAFSVFTYLRTTVRLNTAVLYKDEGTVSHMSRRLKLKRKISVFSSDRINTPVVYGFIKPRIILPLSLVQSGNERALQHIVTHELVHIKRFDYIVKLLWVFALCLHWFNPVAWVSFILFQKDMEMSCDERVMSVCDGDIRSEYATLLINLAAKQNMLLNGGLLAFGESNIKSRIKGIVRYKKPGFWLVAAAIAGVAVTGVLLLTNHAASENAPRPKPGAEATVKPISSLQEQTTGQNDGLYAADQMTPVYFASAIMKETWGKQGPGDSYKDIVQLPYGRLVSISGRYTVDGMNGGWFLASLIPEMSEDGGLIERPENEKKFWVSLEDLEMSTQRTISFDETFPVSEVAEYRYVVTGDPGKDGKAFMRQMPDEKSPYAAIMRDGNLISVVRRDAEWSLVKKFNGSAMEEATRVGWVKNGSYREYKPGLKVTQGFVLRSAKMYESPDTNSRQYPAENLKNTVIPVNILENRNGWTYISSGFNGLALWVKSEEVRYSFTPDELFKLANPDIDKGKMLNTMKSEIRSWKDIELRAEDVGKKVTLTSSQKAALAGKLTAIRDLEFFDGGIQLSREASYPFYRLSLQLEQGLDFPAGEDYQFIVAGEDRLLVLISGKKQDDYGINREGPPLRFIRVNKEFVDYLKSLLPVTLPGDTEGLNYLFNAKKVVVKRTEGNTGSITGNTVQQVNKCVRTLKAYAGEELEAPSVDGSSHELATCVFGFADGPQVSVRLTRQYIQYGNRYYSISGTGNPEEIVSSLMAAYF